MPTRKHKRTRHIYRLRARGTGEDSPFVGQVVNVNPEGMMLIAQEPLPRDTVLNLEVELPHNAMGQGSVEFEAVVRWCEPGNAGEQYGIGMYLEHVPDTSRELLEELMTRFQAMNAEDNGEADPYVKNRPADPLFPERD